jgi:septal ring factor EnvC (AmiA/AmiB activator)
MAGVHAVTETVFKSLIMLAISRCIRGQRLIYRIIAVAFVIVNLGLVWRPGWVVFAEPIEFAVVKVSELNLRAKPTIKGRLLTTLKKGERVAVIEHHDGWLAVRTSQDKTGFVRNRPEYLAILRSDVIEKIGTDEEMTAQFNEKMERSQAQFEKIKNWEDTVLDKLDRTDRALNQARQQVAAAQGELANIEAEIERVVGERNQLEDQIEANEAYANERLVALYKLTHLGRLPILASAQSGSDFFARKYGLEKILVEDDRILSALAKDKSELSVLIETLKKSQEAKKALEVELKEKIRDMTTKRAKRSELLANIRNEKSLTLAAIEKLKQSAAALDLTINSFSTEPQAIKPLDMAPINEFSKLKGLLNLPVKGKIIALFGPYRNIQFNVVNFRSGINIKADRGEPIRAVFDGKTLFSDWFKGYGNMIIIDHGDHYYTVYAHLEEFFKEKGDQVDTGEVIATVGDTGSMHGSGLHFEVRHHGKPMDPMEWVQKVKKEPTKNG